MLKSLFRKAPAPAPLPRVPDNMRVYAIGDIHGRRDLLDLSLAHIEADDAARTPKRRSIVMLGDLIDRGIDSRGVIERAIALQSEPNETHFLAGNHEELLLRAIDGDDEAVRLFVRVGGRETLASYGIAGDDYERADYDELIALMRQRIPADHVAFLRRMEDMVEIGDYAFVHAGIRPGVPLAEQRPAHLRWIRNEFLDHRGPHPRFIVHGHTITEEVDEQTNRIGIDTGAYVTGRLTAVGFDGENRWFLTTG